MNRKTWKILYKPTKKQWCLCYSMTSANTHLEQKVVKRKQLIVSATLVIYHGGDQEDLWVSQTHRHGPICHVLGAHGAVHYLTVGSVAAGDFLKLDVPEAKDT